MANDWSGARIHGDITCELCHECIHTKARIVRSYAGDYLNGVLEWELPPDWCQPGFGHNVKPRFYCPKQQCREEGRRYQSRNFGANLRIGETP